MNPMVFTILAWERELEMQRQARQLSGHDPFLALPGEERPGRKVRNSFFARFPWNHRSRRVWSTRPQSSCECP
jgi:hypothetical protein